MNYTKNKLLNHILDFNDLKIELNRGNVWVHILKILYNGVRKLRNNDRLIKSMVTMVPSTGTFLGMLDKVEGKSFDIWRKNWG